MPGSPSVVAAGAVVSRQPRGGAGKGSLEVVLVHRPRYDDWSFPKGKPEQHEHPTTAAVREVAEETGLHIRLGPPLGDQVYEVTNGGSATKRVHYWVGRVLGDDDVAGYEANDEVDQVVWLPLDKARDRLSYPRDRRTLDEFHHYRKASCPVLFLRHAKARSRRSWRGDDRERPLTAAGQLQAEQLVPVLAAYGVRVAVTSSSLRCSATVKPYADVAQLELGRTPDLAEEEATPQRVRSILAELVDRKQPAVLCTHRPVLPMAFEAAGLSPVSLDPGALAVLHYRRGRVVAQQLHDGPSGRWTTR